MIKKKLTHMTLVFENCEYVDIAANDLSTVAITTAYHDEHVNTNEHFECVIKDSANENSKICRYGIAEVSEQTLFDRLINHRDITQVELHFDDSTYTSVDIYFADDDAEENANQSAIHYSGLDWLRLSINF